ncbi:hypothetical protein FEM08_16330 [Flavobacterium gilvum]|nr:hypothetical protein FEM08_16330 [Flavobacterium gilvum]
MYSFWSQYQGSFGIYAVTLETFLIKLTLFVFGLQLNKSIN